MCENKAGRSLRWVCGVTLVVIVCSSRSKSAPVATTAPIEVESLTMSSGPHGRSSTLGPGGVTWEM
jgi:hypothetical protein